MKVKDLIAILQCLDQDRDIHLVYDCVYDIDIDIEQCDGEHCDCDKVMAGDYFISAS